MKVLCGQAIVGFVSVLCGTSVLGGSLGLCVTHAPSAEHLPLTESPEGESVQAARQTSRAASEAGAEVGPFGGDFQAEVVVETQLAQLEKFAERARRTCRVWAERLPMLLARPVVWAMVWDALPERFEYVDPLSGQTQAFVLVPGDREQGVCPLYVATTETTWDHFGPWALGKDLDRNELWEKRRQGLRPSFDGWEQWDHSHHMGYGQKPAIGMSLLSANRFAQHQAALSGLSIRLPTEAEWEHVYETTQGPLDQVPENLDVVAVHDGNCDLETEAVGSKQANAFGIHDLLGNVSEWVVASGKPLGAVRGGSFATRPKAATGLQREVANQEAWNSVWPNIPRSSWWFVNHIDHGFRLVCDPSPAILKHVAEQAGEGGGRR